MLGNLLTFFGKNKWVPITIGVILTVMLGAVVFGGRGGDQPDNLLTVERGPLAQYVSVTGTVKPVQDIDLASESTGRVVRVNFKEGQQVRRGATLMQISNADLLADLRDAQANLDAAEAELRRLESGSRPEEVSIKRSAVRSAERNLETAKDNLIDSLNNALSKAQNAIYNDADELFIHPRTNPDFLFNTVFSQREIDVEHEREGLEVLLSDWEREIRNINENDDLDRYVRDTRSRLRRINSFLGELSFLADTKESNSQYPESTLESYRTTMNSAENTITNTLSSLNSSFDSLTGAQNSLESAEQELQIALSGASQEEIEAQEARVRQAQARVQRVRAQLSQTYVRSPINGVLTNQDIEPGEFVSTGQTVASVRSTDDFEITANISESDIAKVKVGDAADFTLDAYDDREFTARVASIASGPEIIQGVTTYETTLSITDGTDLVKDGMTANLDILTANKEDVIAVPSRAVIERDEGKFVRIRDGDQTREVKVETGLRGSDGRVEITNGLREGDRVLTFIS